MKKFVYLKLSKQDAQSLARIFSLMEINMRINPDVYSEKAHNLHSLFEQLDYLIHENGKWCDRNDCSYSVKKRKLQEQKESKLLN